MDYSTNNTRRNLFSDCINGHELDFILYAQGSVRVDRNGEENTVFAFVNGHNDEVGKLKFVQEPKGPSKIEFTPARTDYGILFVHESKKLAQGRPISFEGKLQFQIIYTGYNLTSVLIKNTD